MLELPEFVDEVCKTLATDPTCPSVILSNIGKRGYYASVVRYLGSRAQGKQVVCSAVSHSFEEALALLHDTWRASDVYRKAQGAVG